MTAWPARLRGVTETVVTTRGPNGRWNVAALGVHAPDRGEGAHSANGEAVSHAPSQSDGTDGASGSERSERHASHAPRSGAERANAESVSHAPDEREGAHGANADEEDAPRATAYTFGGTRTRRNFAREGEGYVQFVADPVAFARAALTVEERDDPVLPVAAAWARVAVERVATAESGGTTVRTWALTPAETAVVEESVPTTNRGHAAVVEATVAASRLGVPGYDDGELEARLDYFESVCERCGGPREREAFALVRDSC